MAGPHNTEDIESDSLSEDEGRKGRSKGKGGSSCHQCKSRRNFNHLTYCTSLLDKKNKKCRKKFCGHCLTKFYNERAASGLEKATWTCPSCRRICCCAACRRRKDKDGLGDDDDIPTHPPKKTKVIHEDEEEDEDESADEDTGISSGNTTRLSTTSLNPLNNGHNGYDSGYSNGLYNSTLLSMSQSVNNTNNYYVDDGSISQFGRNILNSSPMLSNNSAQALIQQQMKQNYLQQSKLKSMLPLDMGNVNSHNLVSNSYMFAKQPGSKQLNQGAFGIGNLSGFGPQGRYNLDTTPYLTENAPNQIFTNPNSDVPTVPYLYRAGKTDSEKDKNMFALLESHPYILADYLNRQHGIIEASQSEAQANSMFPSQISSLSNHKDNTNVEYNQSKSSQDFSDTNPSMIMLQNHSRSFSPALAAFNSRNPNSVLGSNPNTFGSNLITTSSISNKPILSTDGSIMKSDCDTIKNDTSPLGPDSTNALSISINSFSSGVGVGHPQDHIAGSTSTSTAQSFGLLPSPSNDNQIPMSSLFPSKSSGDKPRNSLHQSPVLAASNSPSNPSATHCEPQHVLPFSLTQPPLISQLQFFNAPLLPAVELQRMCTIAKEPHNQSKILEVFNSSLSASMKVSTISNLLRVEYIDRWAQNPSMAGQSIYSSAYSIGDVSINGRFSGSNSAGLSNQTGNYSLDNPVSSFHGSNTLLTGSQASVSNTLPESNPRNVYDFESIQAEVAKSNAKSSDAIHTAN